MATKVVELRLPVWIQAELERRSAVIGVSVEALVRMMLADKIGWAQLPGDEES